MANNGSSSLRYLRRSGNSSRRAQDVDQSAKLWQPGSVDKWIANLEKLSDNDLSASNWSFRVSLTFNTTALYTVVQDAADDEAAFPPRPPKITYADMRRERLRKSCSISVAELVGAKRFKDAQAAGLAADLERAQATISAQHARYETLQARIAELEREKLVSHRKDGGGGAVERVLRAQISGLEGSLEAAADNTARMHTEHLHTISRLEGERDEAGACLLVANTENEVAFQLVAEKAAHLKQLSETAKQMRAGMRLKNKALKSRVAELETKCQDQDDLLVALVQETDAQKEQLQALEDEKEVLLSTVLVADEERSAIDAGKEAFSEENNQLKALVEQLRGTIASLTTEKAALESKATDQETILMELIKESDDHKDLLEAASVEKDLLLSVAAEDELALRTEKNAAIQAAANAQDEIKRLEVALDASSTAQYALSAQLASVEATSQNQQSQLDIQNTAFVALEKDMSSLELEFGAYIEKTDARVRQLDELVADKAELSEQADEKDAVIVALRERIEHLESKLESQFWSSSSPTAQPASPSTKDAPLITPPATPESSDDDIDETWPSDLPPMTSSSAKVTDRQRPILRAGVLVREALKFCHAPLPRVHIEELAHHLPTPVEYRAYALRDGWRPCHSGTKIPSPVSKPSGLRSAVWDDEEDEEVTSPTPWAPKSPSSPVGSLSPSRIPVFCPMF
ncbi:hypothetical protein FA95DRAFT_1577214 [Auriscalpium vulgare]|uniref:Uncharacterized protein n=1 Tax=Auriscalpium vulgare TaxID=40419 RepID=A0ACB8R8W3_9AGAM|nr:hypothetical protein FA95DRAFT_1577214 [Auriscalpium vulgare]